MMIIIIIIPDFQLEFCLWKRREMELTSELLQV